MRRVLAFLTALGLVVALAPAGDAPAAPAAPRPPLGVYVIVVDGLDPSDVGPLTPALQAFRDEATWYEQSRAVMIAETIPNHVAMMTGVYAERSGITANSFWPRTGPVEDVDLSDPERLTAPTLFTTLARRCPALRTAAALSKRYLYEVFSAGGRNVAPDDHWDPRPTNIPDPDGHSIDAFTADAAIERVPTSDFLFVNLGDVDRSGHVDVTGVLGGLAAFQTFARLQTDRHVGAILQAIRDAGRWERSVVFIVSDHSMDWSAPDAYINLQPDLPAGVAAFANGGADMLYLLNPRAPGAGALLKRARDVALAAEGVEHAWYVKPNPADRRRGTVLPRSLHLSHPNAGDLVVTAEPGWRFSDPTSSSNPIPGNHGSLITRHSTFMIGGGAPFLRRGRSVAPSRPNPTGMHALPEQSENLDVAPTVAWLLGLSTSSYQGRVLREAFDLRRPPPRCGR